MFINRKNEINNQEVVGFINLSKKGNIKLILSKIKINSKKRNVKILVEPENIEQINKILDKEKTILIFSNNFELLKKICDKIIIVKNNKVIAFKSIIDIQKYNYIVITITANEVKKINLPLKKMVIKSIDDNEIKFMYKGDINDMIKLLNNYKIEKLLIENVKIEDIFNSCKEK